MGKNIVTEGGSGAAATTPPKKLRHRSPNYPSIALDAAIERAKEIHSKDGRHPVPATIAHQRWDFSPNSSGATQTEAALKAFGLLEATGEVNSRKVAVTEIGDRIIREAPDRPSLLQKAALQPKMFRELWDRYSAGMPSDDVIRNYLVWERPQPRFIADSANDLIKRFKATIELAKLEPGDKMDWMPQYGGALGSSGEILRDDPPKVDAPPRIIRAKPMTGTREEVFDVPEGGQVILQFPATMTPDTFADFKDWLQIAIRKIGRLVQTPPVDQNESDN